MFQIVIVGRPNVGKSTLFNRLAGTRKSIVGDQPGMTRDRIIQTVEIDGRRVRLVDTGGMIPDSQELILSKIIEQADTAIQSADLILFVVDSRAGVTPLDEALNSLLRSSGKEVVLVVNKVDSTALEEAVPEFFRLGFEELYPISAEHRLGIAELLESIKSRASDADGSSPQVESVREIRVAIIGRPNVGKSSLLNRILGEERVIVSPEPGTTRDAVDSQLQYDGVPFRLVDTAGIRRKGKTGQLAEKLSVVMARKSLKRADVAFLVIDAVEGATHLDATIGGYAEEAGNSILLVVNKWDLVERDTHTAARLEREFRTQLRFLEYAPMIFVSAKTGLRVHRLLELAREASKARRFRVPTGELNDFFEKELKPVLQSRGGGQQFPVLYTAQVKVAPPTFVLFTRSRKPLHFSIERFVSNRLRERYGFFATPIRIVQRLRRLAVSQRRKGSR